MNKFPCSPTPWGGGGSQGQCPAKNAIFFYVLPALGCSTNTPLNFVYTFFGKIGMFILVLIYVLRQSLKSLHFFFRILILNFSLKCSKNPVSQQWEVGKRHSLSLFISGVKKLACLRIVCVCMNRNLQWSGSRAWTCIQHHTNNVHFLVGVIMWRLSAILL